jgi:uncharacterized repeat protein (TIGR01451 family)
MKYLLTLLALLMPAQLLAQDTVSLNSEVFIERVVKQADGSEALKLETPGTVVPGDKLVFLTTYKNRGAKPADNFEATNPIPAAVAFEAAEGAATVSVDGGKSWGALASLKVKAADGTERSAVPADVTHVRWTFADAVPAGQEGKLRFRGIVR